LKHWASFKAHLNGAFLFACMATALAPLAAQSIPQKFLSEVTHPPDFAPRFKPIRYGGVTIRYDEAAWEKWWSGAPTAMPASDIAELNLIVSGKDKKGRPWTVYIEPPREIAPGYAWATDLNADGVDELIFDMSQGGNGSCVGGSKMTVLSFDSVGRPVPWYVEGFIDDDYDWQTNKRKGVQDFGDWNKDGRTELVQFDCYSYSYQDEPGDVFGIADVYELNQAFWRRLPRADRAKHESQYRKHAASTKRELKPRPAAAGTFVPDYSNDPATAVTVRILSMVPALGGESCGVLEGLEIEDGQLAELAESKKDQVHARCYDHIVIEDGVNCFGKPTIVLYSAEQTIAVMNGSSDRAVEMLQQIIREKLPVRLTGQLEEGRCSPAMIWATEP
jgi:hypothetical protein